MQDNPKRLKSEKHYHFQKDRGHDTENCYQLKSEIEHLIRGYLKEFVDHNHGRRIREPGGGQDFEELIPERDNYPIGGTIGIIS